MEVLGLIPARGGSKGIPNKNLASLAGKPLLAYTCEQARAAKHVTRIIVSTDDETTAQHAKRYGVDVPFMRPPALAADNTSMVDVARHALETLHRQEGYQPDALVVLQPTSPLRQARHIDEAIQLFEQTKADTVVSVIPVPHRFNPYAVMRIDEGLLRDFWEGPVAFDRFRRQDGPVFYARNGPAVLVTRPQVVLAQQRLYGARVVPYLMDEKDSVDIDTPFDLTAAAGLLTASKGAA